MQANVEPTARNGLGGQRSKDPSLIHFNGVIILFNIKKDF